MAETVMVQGEINEDELDLILYLLEMATESKRLSWNARGDIIAGLDQLHRHKNFLLYTSDMVHDLWYKLTGLAERLDNKVKDRGLEPVATYDVEILD
jgi:hypothetical protein